MEKIYAQFGVEMTPMGRTVMQKYMNDNPRSIRPDHHYEVGSTERVRRERELFRRYQEYFSVPSEA